ncbi:putative nicotinate-nucleotide adenylyltransferase [Candidatus Rubidus massiliensis]|mgnify:FL=1|nr:MAG: nicotinate (nicotinamide) nucleotide adenylyltransferase [Chlamydia sp. 32-24]CDZ80410.1 putative nicotinate-nucleotide adenylyltransferase [Candidatus Rubidus massiliensis]
MYKKIGLYGGSFDPLHYGHINLAIQILEKKKLDEIWFCPTSLNPLKKKFPPISIEHRLNMLKIGLAELPFHKIYTPSIQNLYTIDLVKHILEQQKFSNNLFYWIIGEDTLEQIDTWHKVDELMELIPFLIGTRSLRRKINLPEQIKKRIEHSFVNIPLMDISSTDIRQRIASSQYIQHLVPGKVIDYIIKYQLYFLT